MSFTATAAYPYVDRDRATAGLRGQLRGIVAGAGAGVPDWTTLVVEGPTAIKGLHRRVWFVWTATVEPALTEHEHWRRVAPEGGFNELVHGWRHGVLGLVWMEQGRGVSRTLARAAAIADRRVTGLSREVLAELVAELGPR